MNEEKKSYKQILKATSLFGGVQFFNIIVSIIRTKFVALLLGANGVGMLGLYQNAIGLISSVSGLGITSSAIREIAAANKTEDNLKISRVISIFRKWILFTGLVGTLISILISPLLSQFSFGSNNYIWQFVFLSVTVILTGVSMGQNTILRGLQKSKDIAFANILGSVIGLITTIPMYYYWGLNGIVPSLILSSILTLLLSSYFVNKIKIERVVIPYRDIIKEGSVMVKFGIMMTLSSLIFTSTTYVLALYISNEGSLNDVGLYQAGIAITSKYVGLIFTAMAMDYYPRLSAVNSEKEKVASLVNQQAEVGLLILTPVIILLISTMPLVIRILYTISFLPIVDFVQWVSIGIFFKCISWSIGFIVLAKSDSKVFFVTELIANMIMLGLNILFYTFLGLEGLGISYLIGYILYLLIMVYVCKNRYDFFFSMEFIKNTLVCLFLSIFAFLIAKVFKYPIAYISGTILLLISIGYSLFILNKRMEVVGWLKSKIKI